MIGINELVLINPKAGAIIISAAITLAMTLVSKYFTNQNRMKELREIQNTCKIKLKDYKGKPEELKKVQQEMLECSLELTKHSMKPMLFAFVPLILLITWLRGVFVGTEIQSTWIWWYIGAGIFSSLLFRRIFKVV